MDYSRKKELLRKYSERLLSNAELDEFSEMVRKGEFDADYNKVMGELDEEAEDVFIIPPAAKDRVEKRIDKLIYADRKTGVVKRMWQSASVAAILLVMFCGYRFWQEYEYVRLTQTYATVQAPNGAVTTIMLADSTRVTLSPGAVFRYPKQFEKNARQVFLDEGRGFFDVAGDKKRPFTVHSSRLATTALGTSFIVQNYKQYGYEKISLYTGLVKIEQPGGSKGGPVLLVPGQEYEKDMGQNQDLVGRFDLSKDPMTNGTLIFMKDRMDIVLYNISSRYHIKLKFNPEMFKDLYVTGTYRQGTVKEVLQSLAFTHHLTVNYINSETYSIMKK